MSVPESVHDFTPAPRPSPTPDEGSMDYENDSSENVSVGVFSTSGKITSVIFEQFFTAIMNKCANFVPVLQI